jgi:ABC-type sugar transport system ATPase subunit
VEAELIRPLLEAHGLGKSFGGLAALEGVDFAGFPGEVHAIAGANGAGKSTLMNLIGGVFPPSAGTLRLGGAPASFASPRAAQAAGVSVVYQELAVLPLLTVAENVHLGRGGRFSRERLVAETEALCRAWGLSLDPRAVAGDLGVAAQQLIEIARALAGTARVLVLDEPTAVLSLGERDRLFAIVAELRRRGLLVLYVTHRLEEIFAIADRVTVLRNGRKVATLEVAATSQAELVRLMIGHEVRERFDLPKLAAAARRIEIAGRTPRGDVALTLRGGEIVGLAGLVGSGRTRLARAIAAVDRAWPMTIRIDGAPLRLRSTGDAIRNGIVYLTEDRKRDGLFRTLPITANASAAALGRFTRAGFLRRRAEREAVGATLARLRLVARALDAPVRELSGGNQQKVLFGRALLCAPRLLVCDEPTRGVDVGAKDEIYQILVDLAAQGVAVLLVSSEMKELLALSHRLVVMRDGRIVREIAGAADEHAVLMAATGADILPPPLAGEGRGEGNPAVAS